MIKHESFNKILFKDFGDVFVRIESCRTFQEFCEEIQEIKKLAPEFVEKIHIVLKHSIKK